VHLGGDDYTVGYEPAESTSGLFGGNSNWRGPIWFPVNFLLIEALRRFGEFFGDDLLVEYPARGQGRGREASSEPASSPRVAGRGDASSEPASSQNSGAMCSLREVADDLTARLIKLFRVDGTGRRPLFGDVERFQRDPDWNDKILFFEYFHGDTGAGLGASHQTGWTALVVDLIFALHRDDDST
jgi:hypothetical protein